MWTVTVLSPLLHTGGSARLMDGTTTGRTPLPYQYSGRHIRYWKVLIVPVEKSAPGVTGKIQVGAVPGDSAQVSVPACGVPVATGTEPNAPVAEAPEPLGAALEQAARPTAPSMAQQASAVARRGTPRAALVPRPCEAVRRRAIAAAFPGVTSVVQSSRSGICPGCRAGVSLLNSHIV